MIRAHRILLVALCAGLFVLTMAGRASAYPWLIRHGYTQCGTCHADPAGGGLLNPYGRAQGEILLRMRYGSAVDKEPTRNAEPLWGLIAPPKEFLVGASVRSAYVRRIPLNGASQGRFILMQADLLGQLAAGRVRANGSIGFAQEGALAASITQGADARIVSRLHWVGVDLGKHKEVLVRAGRMHLPFGIRSIEHTRLVRMETRTDVNAAQQYGVSADYHRGRWRGSAMFVAGNYLISPAKFRSQGYSAFAEYAATPTLALGVSSQTLHTELDAQLLTPTWRQAHGPFVRYSPARSAVISAEWNFLHTSQPTPGNVFFGGVGLLTADLEPIQGLHFGPTLEVLTRDYGNERASYGAWASAWWFFLPHADVRFDLMGHRLAAPQSMVDTVTAVAQLHVYL